MSSESCEELVVSYIPHGILTAFQNDYPYIKELIEYKRDGTLLYLKSQGAIAFYNGNFGLDVKCNVKDFQEFIEFSRNYMDNYFERLLKYHVVKTP